MKGSLQVKNGKYYAVISYKDKDGIHKKKWISTGYEERGNERKAEEKLKEVLNDFEDNILTQNEQSNILYVHDFLKSWHASQEGQVEEITHRGYGFFMNKIIEYYSKKKIELSDFKPFHIQEFYNYLKSLNLKNITIVHYHVLIRKALQYAVKTDLIKTNPADKIERPKKEKYKAEFYNKQELKKLFDCIKGDPLELIIYITAYYGLRRSEVLGLKWSAIDFESKIIKINHKVLRYKDRLIQLDRMKNKASNRTLPLIPQIEQMLKEEKLKQEKNKKQFGKSYNKNFEDYVCVNAMGDLLKPDFLTQHFRVLQDNHNLKRMRFHDLRHSCASLMLSSGVPMKQIQEWLGHSTFQTTADIYAHLDFSSKIGSSVAISNALDFKEESKERDVKEKTEELSTEDIEAEIIRLKRLLKKKQSDFDM